MDNNQNNDNNNLTNTSTNVVDEVEQTTSIGSSLNEVNSNTNQDTIGESNINSETHINNKLNTSSLDKKDTTKKDAVCLAISTFNITVIVPVVITFSALFLLFGGLGNQNTYHIILGICAIYLILSVIFFIISVWKAVKQNGGLKKIFLIVIFLLILLFCFGKLFPNSIIGKPNSSHTFEHVEVKNDSLLVTDDIEIKNDGVFYTTNYVEIHFSLVNKSDKYYNFLVHKLKINDNQDMYFGEDSNSNFGGVNRYVEPHGDSSNYAIYIGYNELEKKNIDRKDIKKLSLKLILYTSEKEDTFFTQQETDYLDIELK